MEKSEVSKPKQKVELSTLYAMAPQQDPVITPKLSNGFSHVCSLQRPETSAQRLQLPNLLHVLKKNQVIMAGKRAPLLNCPKKSMFTCQKLLKLKMGLRMTIPILLMRKEVFKFSKNGASRSRKVLQLMQRILQYKI